MNSQSSQSRLLLTFGASLMAATLPLTSTNCAYANPDRAAAHMHNAIFKDNLRTVRHENRHSRREQRIESRAAIQQTLFPTSSSAKGIAIDPIRTHIQRGNTAILFPGQISTFRTSRPHNLTGSTFTNDAGKTKTIERGVNLDLTSTNANISVGSDLLDGSTTIQVGDNFKTVSVGTKLTAAEYAALNQKLATGSQSLHLSSHGAADSGSLDLNLMTDDGSTIRASQLVVPQNVRVSGDFARTADGVRVTKDIVNYGSIVATSSDASKNTAVIGARDINNEVGASIASQASITNPNLNLAVRADHDLNNDGSITAAGNLELYAGHAINNHGSATATTGDITLTTAPDAILQVNAYNGNFTATNGSINIREAGGATTADTFVYGGNYYSKDLDINAGQGTANLVVNEVSGSVNSTGTAVHFSANTSDLVLGSQCLTGDPTYFNNGNIIIGGDINVDEALAIIAGGDITTNQTNLTIRSRGASNIGHDINIIAGANITAGSGQTPGTLPSQTTGSISGNATTPVTVSGASATGGSVDFTNATGSLFIDANTNQANGNGGNVTMAAFAGSGGGRVLTNTGGGHQIFANGNGTGNNGNVSLIGGATSGQAIQIGAIHAAGSSGSAPGTGDILIVNAQPTTSNSNPITFGTNGSITSGNKIVASNTIGGGSIVAGQGQHLDSIQNVTILSGGATTVGTIDTNFQSIKIVSEGILSVSRMVHNQAGQVELLSKGNITINDAIRADDGILVVSGGDIVSAGGSGAPQIFTDKSANTGNVSVIAGASFVESAGSVQITGASATGGSILFDVGNQIQNLRASSSGGNGDGGDLNVIAYAAGAGTGKIHLPTSFAFDVGSFANGSGINGDISLVAGADTADAIIMGGANAKGNSTNGTGSIYISSSTPGTATLSTGANFAGISAGDFRGGSISPNGGVTITRGLVSSAAEVVINSGAGGAKFNDVSSFGDFQVTSLGDILVAGGVAVVGGAASNQNTLLWTALGNISFSTRILLHANGGTASYVGGGGGVALIAGGTVQTIDNPNPGFSDASIETASGYDGGNITVVAGADFTRVGNTVTINGSSGSGGSILFDGTAVGGFTGRLITHIDSHSQGGTDQNFLDGGNITLISFNDIKVNPDPITCFFSPAGGSFNVPPPVNGSNGAVTMVAPGAIVFPRIVESLDLGGSVTVRYATPGSATSLDVTPMTQNAFGSVTSGSFLTGALSSTNFNVSQVFAGGTGTTSLNVATKGDITVGNLDLHSNTAGVAGGSVVLESGANVSVGTINVSNTSASGGAGIISITSNSATTLDIGGAGLNKTGTLTANAGTTGDGGEIHIINKGTGGVKVTAVPSSTVTDGDGATLELDAGTGILDVGGLGFNINRSAAGTNHTGGMISLTYGSLTGGAGNIGLTANGTGTGGGGIVSVHTTASGSAGDITIGNLANQFTLQTSGGGGSIILNAGGSLALTAAGSVNSADNVFLSSANGITISSLINTKDVRLSANGTIVINNQIFADPITMVTTADIQLGSDLIANGGILLVSGGNITTTASIAIDASNLAGPGGNVVIAAGASFTETANDVTIDGNSLTGGSVNLTNAGGVNLFSTSSSNSGSDAGAVTLIAYKGSSGSSGQVQVPVGTAINATVAAGAGQGGSVSIFGGATTGNAVSIGNVSTSNGAGQLGFGRVNIQAAQPDASNVSPILKSDASYTGSFQGGVFTNGSVAVGNVLTNYANIIIHTNGSITSGNLNASAGAAGDANGAQIDIVTGSAGALTVGTLTANGIGTGDGGDIFVLGGNSGTSIGSIFAKGGSGASGGNGGSYSVTVDTATSYSAGSINVTGNGPTAAGGQVSIVNLGTGGIDVSGQQISLGGNGDGGSLLINAGTGPITCTGVFQVNTGGASASFNSGTIDLTASSITILGNLILSSDSGAAGTGDITITTAGDVVTGSSGVTIQSANDVNLILAGGKIDDRAAIPGPVTIIANGDINGASANINTSSISGTNSGASIILQATTGSVSIGDLTALPNGAVNGGFINISSGSGGISFSDIATAGNAIVNISATNGSVTGSTITAPSQTVDALSLVLNGGTPGDFTLSGVSNIGRFAGQGGGLVTIDNGANSMIIADVGTAQSLNFTTTNAATGFTSGTSGWATTGTVTLNTPRFQLGQSWSAASFSIQNTGGPLVVNGTGGTLFSTTPPAGAPGSPSSPTAINFNSGALGTITLNGTMNFTGDVMFNTNGGTLVSSNGSLYTGANNVVLNTTTWTQIGTGNIVGNKLIILGNTIINTNGDVDLSASDTVFSGRDLAIIASNNILFGNFSVLTSSTTGDAGDITLIAGFAFTPANTPQGSSSLEFTLTGNAGTGDVTQAAVGLLDAHGTVGNGGNITVFARGNVSLGDLDTSSVSATSGSVKLIANGNITVGDITTTTGGSGSGDVLIKSAIPSAGGTVKVQSGVLTSGSLNAGALSNGTISVGQVDTTDKSVNIQTNGASLTLGDVITAHNMVLRSGGAITLSTTSGLNVVADSLGNIGHIDITAATVTGTSPTVVLSAQGSLTGGGGIVSLHLQGDVTLGATDNFQILANGGTDGGSVAVDTTGNLTVQSGGINVSTVGGGGGSINLDIDGVLTLNDTSFLAGANAVSGNSDGGDIEFFAQSLKLGTPTSVTSPLALNANGFGTGRGGLVNLDFGTDPTNIVVGTPAKTPKGQSNFFTISATSGSLGGDGGNIGLKTGGNIVINTTSFQAGPQAAGTGDGARITLESTNATGKAGNVVVLGDLLADANSATPNSGGRITITTKSKSDFVINATKAPKNGIFGQASATGNGGRLAITNSGGGVSVASDFTNPTDIVNLFVGGKGSISAGTGVTVAANTALVLTANTGDIGKKQLLVDTPLVQITTLGGSNVFDTFGGTVGLNGAVTTGKGFTFGTSNNLTLNESVTATTGSITISSGGNLTLSNGKSVTAQSGSVQLTNAVGSLSLGTGSAVNATNGEIILAALDTSAGLVTIGDFSNIITGGKGGNVVITIGQPPKKGTNPQLNVPGFVITPTGKGQAFFGPGTPGTDVTSTGSVAINATNKSVIFNNLSTTAKTITVGNGSVITADPPSKAVPQINLLPMITSSTQQLEQATAATSKELSVSFDSTQVGERNANLLSFSLSPVFDGGLTLATAADTSPDEATISTQTVSSNDLTVSAAFHSERDAGQSEFALARISDVEMTEVVSSNQIANGHDEKRHLLAKGNVVFAPQLDTTVETRHGTIHLKGGTIAVITQTDDALSVYDLHDSSKNAVVVRTGNRQVSLTPGRHVTVSNGKERDYSSVNQIELVQHRALTPANLESGKKLYTSEFSIPSACYAVKPLSKLMQSKNAEANKLASRITKTSAILMALNPDRGDFVQYFKSSILAMHDGSVAK